MYHDELNFPNFRFVSNHPPLKGWKEVFDAKERKKYPKKAVIIKQGQTVECLYFVVSGLIEYTYLREDGSQEMLEVLGAGNIFGLQPIFGRNPAIGSFVAIEDSVIAFMPIHELNSCMDKDPQLAKELLIELSKVTGGLIRQIYEQTFSVDRRIEKVIYLLAEYKKKTTADRRNRIVLSLSQDDLARITRTTRVTVAKVLGELKKQQLIVTSYGEIIVPDMESLGKKILHQENSRERLK